MMGWNISVLAHSTAEQRSLFYLSLVLKDDHSSDYTPTR
jgi:hypothetical protein